MVVNSCFMDKWMLIKSEVYLLLVQTLSRVEVLDMSAALEARIYHLPVKGPSERETYQFTV
jgi:hypothetical protein